jgi:nicotinate-nucleotide pyrophosphorylase (carboxylating)
MPGMRVLEKEAFRCGGGTNHRFNLSGMVMLKENHLTCIEGDLITKIEQIRSTLNSQQSTENIKIEVEINKGNLNKLDSVIQAGVDVVMLDNFSPTEASELVKLIRSKTQIIDVELSGGINESNLVDYAKALPDYISTGSATTKANNLDLSMLIK